MPWTAPIYDERGVTADPQLIDAQGQHTEASCTCFTEQGTLYELSVPECRTIARRGPMYNPYRQTQAMASVAASGQSQATSVVAPSAGSVIGGNMRQVAGVER